jgi:hypothetical protein
MLKPNLSPCGWTYIPYSKNYLFMWRKVLTNHFHRLFFPEFKKTTLEIRKKLTFGCFLVDNTPFHRKICSEYNKSRKFNFIYSFLTSYVLFKLIISYGDIKKVIIIFIILFNRFFLKKKFLCHGKLTFWHWIIEKSNIQQKKD